MNTQPTNINKGVMKRRSVAFGTSIAERIPPINKNKTPKTQTTNVLPQKSAKHGSPVLHVLKRP